MPTRKVCPPTSRKPIFNYFSITYWPGASPNGGISADGKTIVVGSVDGDFSITRTNRDRSPDDTFGADGIQPIDFGGNDSATTVAIQSDGKILVAENGGCCGIKPVELGRLAADGSADPTFVTLEVVGASSGWGSTFSVIIVEGDGRTLFEGSADPAAPNDGPQKGLTRLNPDGSIDESFHPMMDKLIDGDAGSRAAVRPSAA
jgi:uncharacterized delta-60 repeat protein